MLLVAEIRPGLSVLVKAVILVREVVKLLLDFIRTVGELQILFVICLLVIGFKQDIEIALFGIHKYQTDKMAHILVLFDF